jgi:hypothetical protein
MPKRVKSALMFAAGFCLFGLAAALGWELCRYVFDGAGAQLGFLAISSLTLSIGLVHVVGFSFGILLCIAGGIGLLVHTQDSGVKNSNEYGEGE